MFSCQFRGKEMAVCAKITIESKFGELRYRFGTHQALELEFPSKLMSPAEYARGNRLGYGSRGILTFLRLVTEGASYTVSRKL